MTAPTAAKAPAPVAKFTPGLVVKTTEDLRATLPGRRPRKVKAGAILVIQGPYSTSDQCGWSWTADGYCVSIHSREATAWNFHHDK